MPEIGDLSRRFLKHLEILRNQAQKSTNDWLIKLQAWGIIKFRATRRSWQRLGRDLLAELEVGPAREMADHALRRVADREGPVRPPGMMDISAWHDGYFWI